MQFTKIIPGILLSIVVGLVAYALQWGQEAAFGTAWMEGLPLAIALGMGVRFFWRPGKRWEPGIQFMARRVLEFAIVLLGAALDVGTVLKTPVALVVATGALVIVTIVIGYAFGRGCGLGHQLALLVASGNAICGNSAISAIGPAIEAEEKDVALAISFTAVLGVAVVVLLPMLAPVFGLDNRQYGVLAGWSVYAVPQVLAAAYPVSVVSGEIGTLVKLLRVMMLGPIVIILGSMQRRCGERASERRRSALLPGRRSALLPWFILGFGACVALRAFGWISPAQGEALRHASTGLTIGAMASLGLLADMRSIAESGNKVVAAVLLSLGVLISGALVLLRFV